MQLEGEVALAEPYDACSSLVNPDAVKGKVAVVYRGQCMFVQKAKRVEEAGAIAIVIVGEYRLCGSSTFYEFVTAFSLMRCSTST